VKGQEDEFMVDVFLQKGTLAGFMDFSRGFIDNILKVCRRKTVDEKRSSANSTPSKSSYSGKRTLCITNL
jgi:hypothetical protein